MSTIAEIALPTDEFALCETFSQVPGAKFEAVGVVAHKAEHAMPQLQARGSDIASVEQAFDDDRTVTDAELLTKSKGGGLFFMRWSNTISDVLSLITMDDTIVLTADAARKRWTFRVQFGDREMLSAVYDSCHDAGVPIEVQNVHERTRMLDEPHNLTSEQYETLRSAMERGYYEIPREATTEDLAAELGISHQAVSERLRRGHRSLVETGLTSLDG